MTVSPLLWFTGWVTFCFDYHFFHQLGWERLASFTANTLRFGLLTLHLKKIDTLVETSSLEIFSHYDSYNSKDVLLLLALSVKAYVRKLFVFFFRVYPVKRYLLIDTLWLDE